MQAFANFILNGLIRLLPLNFFEKFLCLKPVDLFFQHIPFQQTIIQPALQFTHTPCYCLQLGISLLQNGELIQDVFILTL